MNITFESNGFRAEIYDNSFCLIDADTDNAITDTIDGIDALQECIDFIINNLNPEE